MGTQVNTKKLKVSPETKREGNDGEVNPGDEQSNVDLHTKLKKPSIGHSSNLNQRHASQLESLSFLMSSAEQDFEITDDKFKVLVNPSCSNGLYMEWEKDRDRYFLWVSSASNKLMIKFEFHGGFEASASLLDAKSPYLIFSELFDQNDIWTDVKLLLRELFRSPDEGTRAEHDYLFAFTRTGMIFHFHIFKLLDHLLPPDTETLKLQEVSPTFMFKPLEILRRDEIKGVFSKADVFFDAQMFISEGNGGLDLKTCHPFYDKGCSDMVPHTLQLPDFHLLMLPSPAKNLEWFGFNTNSSDFFGRYHVYRAMQVMGTGNDPNPRPPPSPSSAVPPGPQPSAAASPAPSAAAPPAPHPAPKQAALRSGPKLVKKYIPKLTPAIANPPAQFGRRFVPKLVAAIAHPTQSAQKPVPIQAAANPSPTALATTVIANPTHTPLVAAALGYYEQLTVPMKFYCRSLIYCVKDSFEMEHCFDDFTEDNIFLRGRNMKILGVEILPYSAPQALKNLHRVRDIILCRLGNMTIPSDVAAVLRLLGRVDALAKLDLIWNNVAWMVASERNHLVIDMFEEFSEFLVADIQVQVTQKFDGMLTYEDKFKKNWLIHANRTYNLSDKAVHDPQEFLRYMATKANKLQTKPKDPSIDLLSANSAHLKLDLFKGRTYFANIRHLYTHLSDTARVKKKMKGLTNEEKDVVVSSEFAQTLSDIQVEVPAAFVGSDAKRASYGRFKRYFSDVDFDKDDEK